MSLLINVYTKSKTKNFSAVKAVDSDSLYCCIADYDKNTVDYFFLPASALDDLKALTSFTALAKYSKAHRSDKPFSPTVTTDNKSELVGVVESAGEALCPCGFDGCDNDCNYQKEATLIGRVDKICKDCGYPDDYCICDTCADCGVITKLVDGHTQCPRCYDFSRQPLVKTYSKTKTDDPANYRHEVRYAPIDDDFDDIPF